MSAPAASLSARAQNLIILAVLVTSAAALSYLGGRRLLRDEVSRLGAEISESVLQDSEQRFHTLARFRRSAENLELVEHLRHFPRVEQVTAWTDRGERIFYYAVDPALAAPARPELAPSARTSPGALEVLAPLDRDGEVFAWVQIRLDTSIVPVERSFRQLVIGMALLLAILGVLLSEYALRQVVRPLERAAELADVVSREQRYDRRLDEGCGPREVRLLAAAFNRMLAAVQAYIQQSAAWAEERIRLADAARRAESLRALGLMASGVAHDVNNLLSVVSLSTSMLRDQVGEEGRGDLDRIVEACQRGASMTGRLLRFAGAHPTEPRPEDLSALVRESEALLRKLIRSPRARLRLELDDGLPPIMIDRVDIDQVLINLVVNASEAIGEGGCITVRTRSEEVEAGVDPPPGRYLVLEVEDDGVGMDEALVERVCEPFFTTRGSRGGTGLGLSTVYGIARQQGGALRIRSAPGEGTCISLLIPAGDAPIAAPAPPPRPEEIGGGGLRVLLVEDNDFVRPALSRGLGLLGFEVSDAASGAEALELLRAAEPPFDVLVTDITMPGSSGLQLAEQVRAEAEGVLIILMSGKSREHLEQDYPAQREVLRRHPLVTKPLTHQQLAVQILSRRPSAS